MNTAKPYLAPSLALFRQTVNENFPKRDKSSDGWIGNAAHAKTKSEHNPDDKGCVHAIDVDVDDNDTGRDLRREILKACIGHKAVWYVISNGIIYSRTHNWAALKYTGPNGHFSHVHISILLTGAAETDTTLRLVKTEGNTPWGALYGGVAGTRVIRQWSRGADVRQLQDVLNKWYPKRPQLDEDGSFGPTTDAAVKYFQKNAKLTVDGIVGGKTWHALGFDDRIPA